MAATIYHNPACGTSRTVLGALRDAGAAPEIVEYLKTGWTRALLIDLFLRIGKTPREALRAKESLAVELGLNAPGVSDEAIVAAMLKHPILVERPIVVTDKGAALCRPADLVRTLI
jgi:arsenate reductase